MDGRKVGYLMFRNFTNPSVPALTAAFDQLRAEGATELVLDLRYNGGGEVGIARNLASMIGGNGIAGKTFTQLRFNATSVNSGGRWGVNFRRYIARRGEAAFWAPISANGNAFVSLFGELEGLQGLKQAHRLEVHPEEAQHRAAEVDAVVVAVVPQRQQRHRRNSATVSIKSIAGIAASLSSSKIMLSLLMLLLSSSQQSYVVIKSSGQMREC